MNKRILIVKIVAIGDVIMALPLLTYFKRVAPEAEITWIVGKTSEPIVASTRMVDTIWTVDEQSLFKGSLFNRVRELIAIQSKLAGKFYDLIITGHADWRYRLISLTARSKDRRSFERGGKRQCPLPGRYHGNEYLRLASGIDNSDLLEAEMPSLTLPKSKYTADLHPFVVLAPGGAKNVLAEDSLRRWPIHSYVDLARKLISQGMNIVLTGALSDAWVVPFFQGTRCTNLIGQLDLIELMSLLQESKLLVTHDSGPLHLAKLARCPTLGLFGPTNPWEKVQSRDEIEVLWGGAHLPCRPCYDGKTYAPCKRNLCLQNISPDEVYEKAIQRINFNAAKNLSCTLKLLPS